LARFLVTQVEAVTYDMDTSIEKLADPIVVKCPICWHQFAYLQRWGRTLPLVECPQCSVMLHARPVGKPALATGLSSRCPNPGQAFERRDACRQLS